MGLILVHIKELYRRVGENMKSCFFIGHREASSELLPILRRIVEKHITEYGVTEFVVGGYGGFDDLSAKTVISLKQQYPEITLSLLIPYHPAERPHETPPGFDNTYYPPGMEKVPHKLAIVRANRYMVDHVDYLIAYAWHPASNARNMVEYAYNRERKGKIRVSLIGEDDVPKSKY